MVVQSGRREVVRRDLHPVFAVRQVGYLARSAGGRGSSRLVVRRALLAGLGHGGDVRLWVVGRYCLDLREQSPVGRVGGEAVQNRLQAGA